MNTQQYPEHVQITEVGPRDGLQSEEKMLSTAEKIIFINSLSKCGYSGIEVSSFMNNIKIPNLADAELVFDKIDRVDNCRYSALIANEQGFNRAVACGVNSIALSTSVSDTFCKKNINCSVSESLSRISVILKKTVEQNIYSRVYISCAFDCAYEGKTKPDTVVNLIIKLLEMDCDEISLADTTGNANAIEIEVLLSKCFKVIPPKKIVMHFHNTFNTAMANVLACLHLGLYRFDTSIAGIGGCNFSPGASGNLATEDLVRMLHSMGIKTGIKLDNVITIGKEIKNLLAH